MSKLTIMNNKNYKAALSARFFSSQCFRILKFKSDSFQTGLHQLMMPILATTNDRISLSISHLFGSYLSPIPSPLVPLPLMTLQLPTSPPLHCAAPFEQFFIGKQDSSHWKTTVNQCHSRRIKGPTKFCNSSVCNAKLHYLFFLKTS